MLDLETGRSREYGDGLGDEYAADFSPDGERLLTVRAMGVSMEPHLYDLASGRSLALPPTEGIVRPIDFLSDGESLLVARASSMTPTELFRVRPREGAQAVRPADYGRLDPRQLTRATVVRYPTFDGREIEALLYAPDARPDGARAPAIVEVHGGPTAQFTERFDPLAQHLASRGFAVLQPNVRGSTGYGPEFRDLGRFDWGGGDLKDVVAAAEYLGSQPFVDPGRIGIWGGSYGGFMTYLAVVRHPELWKAACAWVGITDLEHLYDESREHYQYYFRQQMGEPATHRALWQERSAIRYADRLRAKLLIVHGTNDPRCPIDQARTFRDRLVELGRTEGADFEYLELPDEGHGSSDIEQKLRSYRTVAEFFARSL